MWQGLSTNRGLGWRGYVVGLLAAAAAALAVGIPTAVIPNEYFSRMTPVRPQDYVFLVLTAVLTGAVAALYTVPTQYGGSATGKVTTAGLFSFLAVGCPVCNKVVLLLLGTSGALTYWAPLQPVIGSISVALLALTLWLRLRRLRSECPTCA